MMQTSDLGGCHSYEFDCGNGECVENGECDGVEDCSNGCLRPLSAWSHRLSKFQDRV